MGNLVGVIQGELRLMLLEPRGRATEMTDEQFVDEAHVLFDELRKLTDSPDLVRNLRLTMQWAGQARAPSLILSVAPSVDATADGSATVVQFPNRGAR